MNMLLCRPEKITQICGNTLRCVVDDARRIEHIRNILKLQTGDECKAGVLNKGCFDGKVAEISNDKVIIEFDADSVENPPGKMPLTLFVAMQRPNTLKKVIHCAVTMGVEKICFFGSYKVEKSYWQSSVLQEKNLQFELDLAMEQCKDPFEPEIVFCRYFKSFTEDILTPFAAENPVFIAHPAGSANNVFEVMKNNSSRHCGLVVGPEGGFTDYEVGRLEEMGLHLLSLGDRVLRTEFALAALLEIFNLHYQNA
ncbi:MAG: 16S rRNA (uracil(1498)-N(3))-methyltransferase [Lentisphaeria bacterium]|nr:16S rRNA (uracil(1498)-N(3))-methyltransferase [Lentisphaeria bacterium]